MNKNNIGLAPKKANPLYFIYKNLIIIAIILFIIISFSMIFILNKNKIYKSPGENNFNFCSDSDGNLSLEEQSKIAGNVLFIHRECSWTQLNEINSSGDICAYSLTYNDYCLNNKILREKTCASNIVDSVNITCSDSCNSGACM